MTDTVKIDEKALERAARALCRIDFGRCRGTKRKDVENYVDEEWFEHEEDARAAITAYLTAREEAGFVEVNVKGIDLAEMRERARKEPVPTILLLSQAKVYEDRAVLLAMLAAKPAD
jgi:hypothetical protein